MPDVSDQELMAWVDGELDAETAARVQAHVQAHPDAAARVADLQALNTRLRAAYAADLDEPLPAALLASARGPQDHGATVVPLPTRPARTVRPWTDWARWGGMAACLVLALWGALRLSQPGPEEGAELLANAGGRVLARGALAEALERGLAREAPQRGVRLMLSFKDQGGQYCRTFSAPVGAGLACHTGSDWQVTVLAAAPSASAATPDADRLRLASTSLPATVLEAVEQRIAGLALDAEQERAARDRGWAP